MIDLAVVGGGAAGIAAARAARERGLTCLILEASDRIGGRTQTVGWHGHALDLGATWLHSAEHNPMAALADEAGIAIDRSPIPWREQYGELGFSRAEQAQAWKAMETFAERLRSDPPPGDRASDALEPGGEWNGYLEALNGFLNGTGLANNSAADFIAYWDSSESSNWRLPRGYGGLVSALAAELEVRTGWPVQRVEWTAAGVRLGSEQGVVEARRAVIAVPTNVLTSGTIAFAPKLDERLDSAARLPLGRVEKLFLALPDPESAPLNAHLIGNPRSGESGSYMLRPLGMPLVEGLFGGDRLEGLGAEELAAKTRDELGGLLGANFARGLHAVAHSDWHRHRFIGGSYSYAKPGGHGARAALAAPVDGPLAFAGEACSGEDFGTVQGAWESGRAAVAQLFGAAA